jgi:tetratricopeptide (TPR) repeat protein|tara:strand:+ start:427 stop:978 length:552 start_codon:yes stop_codon:yes gene_type:complete
MNYKNIKIEKYQETINLIENKEYDKSLVNLTKFIEEDKNDFYAHQLLSLVYVKFEKLDAAINHLNTSIELNSKNPGAYYNLGMIYQSLKNFDKSIELFLKTIEQDPNFIDAYLSIAKICQNNNNMIEANKYYQKALLINKDNLPSNKLYSNFLIKVGELTKGLTYQYKYFGVVRFDKNGIKII